MMCEPTTVPLAAISCPFAFCRKEDLRQPGDHEGIDKTQQNRGDNRHQAR